MASASYKGVSALKVSLSSWPGMGYGYGDEGLLVGGEGSMDGVDEGGQGGVATLGHPVMLDGAEGGLDRVQLGAVGREEVEVDAARPEVGDGGAGLLAPMD